MKTLIVAAAILALQGRALAQQKMYQWIDQDGNIHLSDHPTEQQTGVGTRAPASPARSAPPAEPKSAEPKAVEAKAVEGKTIELPYVPFEGSARRVIVNVRFNGQVTAPLALDTGSPGMIISASLAKKLDLFSRDQGKLVVFARGIGGDAPAIRGILENVEIGGAVERFVPVTVTSDLSSSFAGLVGMDFMGEYAMTIDPKRKVVVLQEQPRGADAPGGHSEHWWRANFAEFRGARDKWHNLSERLEDAASRHTTVDGMSQDEFENLRTLARLQSNESETLLSRLESYASAQSVPRHWR